MVTWALRYVPRYMVAWAFRYMTRYMVTWAFPLVPRYMVTRALLTNGEYFGDSQWGAQLSAGLT